MWETLIEITIAIVKKLYKALKTLKRPTERQIDLPPYRSYTSRFANTEEDLGTVLGLRRSFFGKYVIVPDDIYRGCWQRNPDTMKIVSDYSGHPVGYWSVIPIGSDSFAQFVKGEISHSEMMSAKCLPWTSVDPQNTYLYVVGAVVPVPRGRSEIKQSRQQISGHVMFDLLGFGLEILSRLEVKGICGYPTKTAGLTIFQNEGFVRTEILIDNDKDQPVYVLTGDGVVKFHRHLKSRKRNIVSVWDPQDKKRFLRQIGSRTNPPKPTVALAEGLDHTDLSNAHANIRILVTRMDDALNRNDFAGVLHASASIFETMAKDVVGIPSVEKQPLKSFFDRYREDSDLPTGILDYMLGVYELRNTTPLAGHGGTQTPAINRKAAISLSEMTKAFINIEYRLRQNQPRKTRRNRPR